MDRTMEVGKERKEEEVGEREKGRLKSDSRKKVWEAEEGANC